MRGMAIALLIAAPLAAGPREIVLDRDDIEVAEDVVVKPGTYVVADANGDGVLHVKRDGVTIDFRGAALLGAREDVPQDALKGLGIRVEGRSKVTIKGAVLSGFLAGIVAERCSDLTIEGCTFRRNRAMRLKSTPEAEDGSDWLWPHNNDHREWLTNYGAAASLEDCKDCIVRGNTARAEQNGILLTRCSHVEVYDNDCSYLSGWGLAMYRSCDCVVSCNSFDWCVRGYSHGVYARGQDSAAILVFEQCSRNVFARNSATHGGDGFFLYAGHETTQRTGKGGCNDNLVWRNDFSHAVANGIEATFSEGNRFVENVLDECDYGIWGGYSYGTYVAGNRITRSLTAGIAIEHGHDNAIEGNDIRENARALWLWWDEDKDLVEGVYGKHQDTRSHGYAIRWNCFARNREGDRIDQTKDVTVEDNFVGDSADPPPGFDPAKRSRKVEVPEVPGTRDAFLPKGHRRGRQCMIVDEWGPYDFSAPRVFPRTATAWEAASFYVLGPEAEFSVEGASEGIVVEPSKGKLPATLKVRAKDAAQTSYLPFSFNVRVAGAKQALGVSGVLLTATWEVSWFPWTKDPRQDAEAWKALIAGKPARREALGRLAFNWGGGGPEGMAPDRFGTLATTTLSLPAGKYVVKTVSDDGVRVWIDGKAVIDNWTWHAPTEDRAEVDLAGGRHDVRLDHFEIDGWSVLSFTLDRVE